MNRLSIAASLTAVLAAGPSWAALDVVTTTEDLASIAREVGGDKIKVESLSRGYQDPHYVEPKPSFVLRLHGADLLIVVGRELEIGWLPPLLTQARNPKIQPGGAGYLDASQNAKILDVPTGQITRAMGDVHPLGNPHYWLDPENGRRIARSIQEKLAALAPADAAFFAARADAFDEKHAEAETLLYALMSPYSGL
jgi:zinc/manganese transport system substrate-binding protein